MIIEKLQGELQKPAWYIEATTQELDRFTLPFIPMQQEQKILDQFRLELNINKPYETGLVIGRFQPLHYGHIFLIKEALEVCNNVVVGIGSSNNSGDMDNPWDASKRFKRMERVIDELGIQSRIKNIVCLADYFNDKVWLSETIRKAGKPDAVIGNNDWVNGIFEGANIPVITTPLYHRDQLEGKTIRAKLRSKARF